MNNMTMLQLIPKSPAKIAGLLSLLSTMFVLAIWFILLFVGIPADQTIAHAVIDQITYLYSDQNPARLTFIWLAVLPFISSSIGTTYLLDLARTKMIAGMLLVVTIAIGLVVLAFGPLSLAIFVMLPSYWGWKCLESIQTTTGVDS
jgi:hypothetical protein